MSKNKKNKELDLASEYIFLSYSGLQGLSILGPILSLLNTGIKLAKCGIFSTEKSKPHAVRAIEFLKSYKTIDFEIEIVDVEDDNSSIEVVSNWLDNNYIDNRKSIFNTAGGQNKNIPLCLHKLLPKLDCLFVASSEVYRLYDVRNNKPITMKNPDKLTIEQLLEAQGVPYYKADPNKSSELYFESLNSYLGKSKIVLPEGSMQNISVEGINIDFIVNTSSNRPQLFIFLLENNEIYKNDKDVVKAIKQARLDYLRKIIALSNQKQEVNSFFDRMINVFTNSKNFKEHIEREGNSSKIVCKFFDEMTPTSISKYIQNAKQQHTRYDINTYKMEIIKNSIEKTLARIKQTIRVDVASDIKDKYKDPIRVEKDSLIICFSNPGLALRVIASHKLSNIVFLCTIDKIEEVDNFIEVTKDDYNFKVSTISIDGIDIENKIESLEDPASTVIDTLPGTKGQGVFLAMFGFNHGCQVWTSQSKGNLITRIDAKAQDKTFDAAKFDEAIKAKEGLEALVSVEDDYKKNLFFDYFCKFLPDSGFNLENFGELKSHKSNPKAIFDIDDNSVTYKSSGYTLVGKNVSVGINRKYKLVWSLNVPNNELNDNLKKKGIHTLKYIKSDGGEWLEILCARAVTVAFKSEEKEGHALSRVRRRRNGNQDTKVKADEAFLADYDVLGDYNGLNFLISCKSNANDKSNCYVSIESESKNVKNSAMSFDRFTAPLLCHLGCDKKQICNGVVVFGQKELEDPKQLITCLDEAQQMLFNI